MGTWVQILLSLFLSVVPWLPNQQMDRILYNKDVRFHAHLTLYTFFCNDFMDLLEVSLSVLYLPTYVTI